jgi:3-dehydroquinate dehydratase II
MNIIIINGPNLNMTGQRETELYGSDSFENYLEKLKKAFKSIKIEYYQSNHSGHIIDKLQEVGYTYDGIIINPGALTHTSLALGDAVAAVKIPVIEVHMTNLLTRERIRHQSMVGPYCKAVIMGLGLESYRYALQSFVDFKAENK